MTHVNPVHGSADAKQLNMAVIRPILALVFALMLLATPWAEAQTFTVLYSFKGPPDGGLPLSGVVRDAAGNLYGTTWYGGAYGYGTVFKISKCGKEKVLYSFTGGLDGANPYGGLSLDADGNLYGTTETGGYPDCIFGYGCGTVFKIDKHGKYSVLYHFGAMPDGAFPYYVTPVFDQAGSLYGTTFGGGDNNCDRGWGCGTVFRLDKTGKETILHTFTGTEQLDGAWPYAGLVRDEKGNLYSTTASGGAPRGYGTVFKLDKTGRETVLHRFSGWSASGPVAGVIRDDASNIYGIIGGYTSYGMVFKLNRCNKETVLHNFSYDEGSPEFGVGLLRDAKGNLYASTVEGSNYEGMAFKLDKSGNLTVLHNFSGWSDGGFPVGTLIMDEHGNLYGVARDGGNFNCGEYDGCGVVFEITP